jgi:rRNA maturation endonuclease Nob1
VSAFTIYVLDTNAVINLKKRVRLEEQWDLFQRLQSLVLAGRIAFPRQVVKEVSEVQHPDAPGVWLVGGAASHMQHAQPSEESLAEVLAVAPGMVDPDATFEHADPYVVAMAWELAGEAEFDVIVASDDKTDRPGNTSVVTACERLGLETCSIDEFISWVQSDLATPIQEPLPGVSSPPFATGDL